MSRHIHLTHDVLWKLRFKGELNIPAEDRAILGDPFEFEEEEGGSFQGARLFLGEDKGWRDTANPSVKGACLRCLGSGWVCVSLVDPDGNTVTFEWDSACDRCPALETTRKLLPQMYRWVEYDTLKPFPGIPVPIERQQELLDQIQSGDLDGHSVLYSGPSRASKSVMASALLGRMVERYLANGFRTDWSSYRLPIYRINVDEWLGEHAAWDLHQWDSERRRPEPPLVNKNTIGRLVPDEDVSGLDPRKFPDCPEEFPPVLVLEEMDKFTVTEYKLDALFTIVNSVFERGGQIIATCNNLTEKEIRDRFPDWFYRRLVESSIDHKIRHRDLSKVVGRSRKKTAVQTNETTNQPEIHEGMGD